MVFTLIGKISPQIANIVIFFVCMQYTFVIFSYRLHFIFFRLGKELKVTVGKPVHCMLGSKRRTVMVRPTAVNGGATFKKEGTDIALMWPE